MIPCKQIPGAYGRTVGDPVDVVTGANLDVTTEFQLMGPLPLKWHRYYDSSQNGQTMITRGGPNDPGTVPSDTCLVHTHPHQTPPSPGDLSVANSPQGQAIIGPDGRVTDYDRNGPNPHATTSPIADNGTIDGNHHPINPIVKEGWD